MDAVKEFAASFSVCGTAVRLFWRILKEKGIRQEIEGNVGEKKPAGV